MNIITIDVPNYVNYISEWNELDMNLLKGHIIMDKTITGCGFTEYFLRNTQNVVLCSPRKILLENKSEQHKEIFYVKNELEKSLGIDQELNFTKPGTKEFVEDGQGKELGLYSQEKLQKEKKEKQTYILQLKQNISDYIDQCFMGNKAFKILVTYDSLKHVLEVLKNKFTPQAIDTIQFVVDEFQSIFIDSKFKATVELDFIDFLQDCSNVCYLSATPMIEKYLDRIEEFKNLPYYKLIWDPSKVVKAKIIRKNVSSILDECEKIIDLYRNGTFPRKILEDKSIHESKEVVFYVNSVKTICSIVRKCKLLPSETNIICSKDIKNKKKLKSVGHQIGSVPVKPEDNKMFTFCTRTVYLGSDFYSTSAYTVVCSDCTVETLCVDIQLDLPQILGRQRMKENVFRNECLLFYKIQKKPVTRESFDQMVENKRKTSTSLLNIYNGSLDSDRSALLLNFKKNLLWRYKDDYVGIRSKTDSPIFNDLVILSEERAWEVSQLDYQNDITVKRILESDYEVKSLNNAAKEEIERLNIEYKIFLENFNREAWFEKKMKLYCDFLDSYYSIIKTTDLPDIPRDYQNYVNLLGTKRVKALKYQKSDCENEYQIIISQDIAKESILRNFKTSEFITVLEIKNRLQEIYDSLGLKKKAKATDLENYFEVETRFKRIDGKNVRCIDILRIKY